MIQIFHDKKKTILFVSLTMVLVILVVLLLTNITQLTILGQKEKEISTLISDIQNDIKDKEDWLKYKETNEYVIDWAKENGKLTKDELAWISANDD